MGRGEKLQGSQLIDYLQLLDNEGKTRVKNPFGNGLNPTYKMMIWGMVYHSFTYISCFDFFFHNSKTLLWVLQPRLAPVRSGAASTPGSGQGSGGFWCRYLVRFRKFPVQVLGEVSEGLGEDAWWGSGRFRCRDLMRFRRFLAEKMLGADTLWGSGGFWCRCFVKLQRVPFLFFGIST